MQRTRHSFPRPDRERWQPMRSGFVNLYRYDREEFHYENGRLLLRGNNGTGKSRVLALQLPFLLDGEVIPQRLEPDADPAKRIEWNLLMGRYPDRTGYTWIEFGRRDSEGIEHYLTLGCGLSAVEYQTGVRKWFFITRQRIGMDLDLINDTKQVLGKDRLREKIGDAGQLFETAGAYRRAVNQALFHLHEHRYASFVNLLIQLRRPQLTRRFDEDELSRALSEALPPVSAAVTTKVAEAFRNLESDRSQLESFKAALTAVDGFLVGYRRYAEVAAKRRADRVLAAHHEYEEGMKNILVSESDCDRSLAELARLKAEIQRLSVEQHAVQTEIAALQQSPHMKDTHALGNAQREAREKRKEADAAAAELLDAQRARKARAEEHIRTKAILEQRQARMIGALETARQAASSAGLAAAHREIIEPVHAQYTDERLLKEAREKVESAIQTQVEKVAHAGVVNAAVAAARNELHAEGNRKDQLAGMLDDAREHLNGATQESNSAVISFLESTVDGIRSRLAEAERCIVQKESRLNEAIIVRDRAVTDLGLAAWTDDLQLLEQAISTYRLALAGVWPAMESLIETRTAIDNIWARVEEAGAREARQKEITDRLAARAVASEIAHDTLTKALGAEFDEILQRVSQARRRLDELRIQEKEARRVYHDTELVVTRVDERLRNRTEMLNGQTDRRNVAALALYTFAGTRLLHLAAPDMSDDDATSWSTPRTVEVAVELAATLKGIESGDAAWEILQKSVPAQFNALMQTLSAQGCQSSAMFRDDVFVATATFAGRERTMEDLQGVLSDEVTARQMLLDAREREILENHLVGEVAGHLRELINAAEELVRQMNLEMESRPMSTGMKLRFVWRTAEDRPLGLAEARRLMQSTDPWSAAERRSLGAFLQQQIQALCSDLEGGTWHESLSEALDYRNWHRFGVERHQEGVWKRLTRRTHGTGSGGEKAVALTLPHFAAAAAFYRTAHPLAPRLILLDEAFVGIDADMRSKCMGLIHNFDLDFIMTSEREWGCYQTLPGLAIYQLTTRPGIDAVGLTRWVWNGQQRILNQNLEPEESERASLAHASG